MANRPTKNFKEKMLHSPFDNIDSKKKWLENVSKSKTLIIKDALDGLASEQKGIQKTIETSKKILDKMKSRENSRMPSILSAGKNSLQYVWDKLGGNPVENAMKQLKSGELYKKGTGFMEAEFEEFDELMGDIDTSGVSDDADVDFGDSEVQVDTVNVTKNDNRKYVQVQQNAKSMMAMGSMITGEVRTGTQMGIRNTSVMSTSIVNAISSVNNTLLTGFQMQSQFFNTMTDHLSKIQMTSAFIANDQIKTGGAMMNLADELMENFDFDKYASYVMDRINSKSGVGSMLEMIGTAGKEYVLNPVGKGLSHLIQAAIPNNLKESIKELDETLAYLPQELLRNIDDIARKKDMGFLADIAKFLKLEPSRLNTDIAPNKISDGPIPWDGKSKRALEFVIPTYLSNIDVNIRKLHNVLNSTNPMTTESDFYDYEKNKFSTVNKVMGENLNFGKEIASVITSDLRNQILREFATSKNKKVELITDAESKEVIHEAIVNIIEALSSNGGDITKLGGMNLAKNGDKEFNIHNLPKYLAQGLDARNPLIANARMFKLMKEMRENMELMTNSSNLQDMLSMNKAGDSWIDVIRGKNYFGNDNNLKKSIDDLYNSRTGKTHAERQKIDQEIAELRKEQIIELRSVNDATGMLEQSFQSLVNFIDDKVINKLNDFVYGNRAGAASSFSNIDDYAYANVGIGSIGVGKKFGKLSDTAKKFVLAHEKGHIAKGHMSGARNVNEELEADQYAAEQIGGGKAKSALNELSTRNSKDYELKVRGMMKYATNNQNNKYKDLINETMHQVYENAKAEKGHTKFQRLAKRTSNFFFGEDQNRLSIVDSIGQNFAWVSRKLLESLFGTKRAVELEEFDHNGNSKGTFKTVEVETKGIIEEVRDGFKDTMTRFKQILIGRDDNKNYRSKADVEKTSLFAILIDKIDETIVKPLNETFSKRTFEMRQKFGVNETLSESLGLVFFGTKKTNYISQGGLINYFVESRVETMSNLKSLIFGEKDMLNGEIVKKGLINRLSDSFEAGLFTPLKKLIAVNYDPTKDNDASLINIIAERIKHSLTKDKDGNDKEGSLALKALAGIFGNVGSMLFGTTYYMNEEEAQLGLVRVRGGIIGETFDRLKATAKDVGVGLFGDGKDKKGFIFEALEKGLNYIPKLIEKMKNSDSKSPFAAILRGLDRGAATFVTGLDIFIHDVKDALVEGIKTTFLKIIPKALGRLTLVGDMILKPIGLLAKSIGFASGLIWKATSPLRTFAGGMMQGIGGIMSSTRDLYGALIEDTPLGKFLFGEKKRTQLDLNNEKIRRRQEAENKFEYDAEGNIIGNKADRFTLWSKIKSKRHDKSKNRELLSKLEARTENINAETITFQDSLIELTTEIHKTLVGGLHVYTDDSEDGKSSRKREQEVIEQRMRTSQLFATDKTKYLRLKEANEKAYASKTNLNKLDEAIDKIDNVDKYTGPLRDEIEIQEAILNDPNSTSQQKNAAQYKISELEKKIEVMEKNAKDPKMKKTLVEKREEAKKVDSDAMIAKAQAEKLAVDAKLAEQKKSVKGYDLMGWYKTAKKSFDKGREFNPYDIALDGLKILTSPFAVLSGIKKNFGINKYGGISKDVELDANDIRKSTLSGLNNSVSSTDEKIANLRSQIDGIDDIHGAENSKYIELQEQMTNLLNEKKDLEKQIKLYKEGSINTEKEREDKEEKAGISTLWRGFSKSFQDEKFKQLVKEKGFLHAFASAFRSGASTITGKTTENKSIFDILGEAAKSVLGTGGILSKIFGKAGRAMLAGAVAKGALKLGGKVAPNLNKFLTNSTDDIVEGAAKKSKFRRLADYFSKTKEAHSLDRAKAAMTSTQDDIANAVGRGVDVNSKQFAYMSKRYNGLSQYADDLGRTVATQGNGGVTRFGRFMSVADDAAATMAKGGKYLMSKGNAFIRGAGKVAGKGLGVVGGIMSANDLLKQFNSSYADDGSLANASLNMIGGDTGEGSLKERLMNGLKQGLSFAGLTALIPGIGLGVAPYAFGIGGVAGLIGGKTLVKMKDKMTSMLGSLKDKFMSGELLSKALDFTGQVGSNMLQFGKTIGKALFKGIKKLPELIYDGLIEFGTKTLPEFYNILKVKFNTFSKWASLNVWKLLDKISFGKSDYIKGKIAEGEEDLQKAKDSDKYLQKSMKEEEEREKKLEADRKKAELEKERQAKQQAEQSDSLNGGLDVSSSVGGVAEKPKTSIPFRIGKAFFKMLGLDTSAYTEAEYVGGDMSSSSVVGDGLTFSGAYNPDYQFQPFNVQNSQAFNQFKNGATNNIDLAGRVVAMLRQTEHDGNPASVYKLIEDPERGVNIGTLQINSETNKDGWNTYIRALGLPDELLSDGSRASTNRIKALMEEVNNRGIIREKSSIVDNLDVQFAGQYVESWKKGRLSKLVPKLADEFAFMEATDTMNQYGIGAMSGAGAYAPSYNAYIAKADGGLTAYDIHNRKMNYQYGKKKPQDVNRRFARIIEFMNGQVDFNQLYGTSSQNVTSDYTKGIVRMANGEMAGYAPTGKTDFTKEDEAKYKESMKDFYSSNAKNNTKPTDTPNIIDFNSSYAKAEDKGFPSIFNGNVGVSNYTGTSSGKFAYPTTAGRISSPFGLRLSPKTGASTNHQGIDIAVAYQPCYAADDGKVIFAGTAGGYGNLIKISHSGGYESRYGHLSKIIVGLGAIVTKGQIIGYTGNSGNSTGPHLHFEIRQNNRPIDPMYLFDKSLGISKSEFYGPVQYLDKNVDQDTGVNAKWSYDVSKDFKKINEEIKTKGKFANNIGLSEDDVKKSWAAGLKITSDSAKNSKISEVINRDKDLVLNADGTVSKKQSYKYDPIDPIIGSALPNLIPKIKETTNIKKDVILDPVIADLVKKEKIKPVVALTDNTKLALQLGELNTYMGNSVKLNEATLKTQQDALAEVRKQYSAIEVQTKVQSDYYSMQYAIVKEATAKEIAAKKDADAKKAAELKKLKAEQAKIKAEKEKQVTELVTKKQKQGYTTYSKGDAQRFYKNVL